MKIGVFGGTFNPPHTGHLIVAECVREAIGLGKVLFIPSSISPHKQDLNIIEGGHRLEMLKCAVQDNPYFEVSDIELQRGGVSYTVDTLRQLKKAYLPDSLHLIIGMDNVVDFPSWKEYEEIKNLACVVVIARPGFDAEKSVPLPGDGTTLCEIPLIDISSRDIRARVKTRKSIRYRVPAAVESYIRAHQLYL